MDGNHVAWIFELTVKDGHDATLRALMTEMVDATRAGEPGTLDYEWYLSEDGRRLHIYERYADAAATLVHLGNFSDRYMTRFFGVRSVPGVSQGPVRDVRAA
jgi:quinol monooxygenase YgiN